VFTAKEESVISSPKYKVDSICWHLLSSEQWHTMRGMSASEDQQRYDIQLPHCHPNDPARARVEIGTLYGDTSTRVPSCSCEVEFPKLGE